MRFHSIARALLCAGWLVLSTTGCWTSFWHVSETDGTLEDSMLTYSKLVRWGELERASLFVDESVRPEFIAISDRLGYLRFTDFDLGPVDRSEDGSARVTAVYRVYDVRTLVERTIVEEQQWDSEGHNDWKVRPDLSGFQSALGMEPSG